MGTPKRERKKANRQLKVAEQRRAEQKDGLRRRVIMFSIIGLLVLGGLYYYSTTGDDESTAADATTTTVTEADDDPATDADAETEGGTDDAADETTDDTTGETTDEATEDGDDAASGESDGDAAGAGCPPEAGTDAQTLEFATAPPDCLVDGASYSAVIETSMGTIEVDLDRDSAPLAVNSFVFLARHHYYDGNEFHRVITDFVIQGGDPVGDPPGTGGPGYTIADEPPTADYQIGSLAMARPSLPDSVGSQFFIITGERGAALPGDFSLFGQVTSGLDIAQEIQTVETDDDDRPVEPVLIESITINQS